MMNKNITCTLCVAIFLFAINATTHAQMSKIFVDELPPVENNEGEPEMVSYKDQLIRIIEKEDIFLQPDVSDESIARLLRTSSSVVEEIIRQDFGHSFKDYVNKRRIDAAIKKLDHPDFQHPDFQEKEEMEELLTDIALNVGYKSKGHFSKMFKKNKDISLEKYMEMNSKRSKKKRSRKVEEADGQE